MGSQQLRRTKVHATERGRITVISLRGEFDLGVKQQFGEVLEKIDWQRAERVVVDLRGVTFIGAAGLGMLLRLWSKSQHDGFTLAIVPGRPDVQRVLAGMGLDSKLQMIKV